jgi:hypothetical protein
VEDQLAVDIAVASLQMESESGMIGGIEGAYASASESIFAAPNASSGSRSNNFSKKKGL